LLYPQIEFEIEEFYQKNGKKINNSLNNSNKSNKNEEIEFFVSSNIFIYHFNYIKKKKDAENESETEELIFIKRIHFSKIQFFTVSSCYTTLKIYYLDEDNSTKLVKLENDNCLQIVFSLSNLAIKYFNISIQLIIIPSNFRFTQFYDIDNFKEIYNEFGVQLFEFIQKIIPFDKNEFLAKIVPVSSKPKDKYILNNFEEKILLFTNKKIFEIPNFSSLYDDLLEDKNFAKNIKIIPFFNINKLVLKSGEKFTIYTKNEEKPYIYRSILSEQVIRILVRLYKRDNMTPLEIVEER
jgi:hypothetical protein